MDEEGSVAQALDSFCKTVISSNAVEKFSKGIMSKTTTHSFLCWSCSLKIVQNNSIWMVLFWNDRSKGTPRSNQQNGKSHRQSNLTTLSHPWKMKCSFEFLWFSNLIFFNVSDVQVLEPDITKVSRKVQFDKQLLFTIIAQHLFREGRFQAGETFLKVPNSSFFESFHFFISLSLSLSGSLSFFLFLFVCELS
jgi:hypothetical protein